MLDQGIIEESCSPWLAPAVFVRKKSGDIRLCVDYRKIEQENSEGLISTTISGSGQAS